MSLLLPGQPSSERYHPLFQYYFNLTFQILGAHPELKSNLESAMKFQASRSSLALQNARAKQAENKVEYLKNTLKTISDIGHQPAAHN